MEKSPKLRFGVLCHDLQLHAWEAEACRRLQAAGRAEPIVAITGWAPPSSAPPEGSFLYHLYESRWVRPRSRALQPADSAWLDEVEVLHGPITGDELRGLRLDFLLWFGGGPIPEGLLEATRFGVWCFDQASEPARPGCFWELVRGEARTEVALLRLLDRDGGAAVLHRGAFGTCRASWVNNLDRALLGAADFPARVCAEIAIRGSLEPDERPRTARPGPRAPSTAAFLQFLAAVVATFFRKSWELLFHLEVWNVGFNRDRLEEIVERGAIDHAATTWCPPHRPGFFIADPFGWERDGKEQILVEEYDQTTRGWISRLARPRPGGPLELAVEIEEPHHMSYPCLYREDDQVYCVPETYQAGGACLYRLGSNGRWDLVRTIVEGPIVDPTLFRHGGYYWLLCTHQDDGSWGNQKLHGYRAESLTATWTPHPLNPLKSDITSCRPAGRPFEIGGVLYRPSQDCSRTYGGAVVINRVDRLSPTEFSESVAATIRPLESGPYPHGLHTINRVTDGTVIDGKRFIFDLSALRINRSRFHEVFL
jgi:hypothetical protein